MSRVEAGLLVLNLVYKAFLTCTSTCVDLCLVTTAKYYILATIVFLWAAVASLFNLKMHKLQSYPFQPILQQTGLTDVMVSAEATMSARPALMMCSSRSFSMGSIPLGTLSISENIKCSSVRRKEEGVFSFIPRETHNISDCLGSGNEEEAGSKWAFEDQPRSTALFSYHFLALSLIVWLFRHSSMLFRTFWVQGSK